MEPDFVDALLRWLASGECRRITDASEALAAICERIVAGGVPLWRVSTTLVTMHPEIQSLELVWNRDAPASKRQLPHSITESPEFLRSPVEEVLQTHVALRRRGEELRRYPQLAPLVEKGCTDYVAVPVELNDGRWTAMTYATDEPDGFRPEHLAAMDAIWPALTLRLDLGTAIYTLRSLMHVYLGNNAADRVLRGAFRRGQGESITAAIWYCDLRGFTRLSDELPAAEVVALLDRYFEAIGSAVRAHHGEILKFIGDAALAVFPVDAAEPREPCLRALEAAALALENLERLQLDLTREDGLTLRMGVALHLGEVMFGNIGGRDRLDFTIIGRSVNEAVRLESLCKELGVPLVLSGAFVKGAGLEQAVSLGEHTLRGVRAPQEVFTMEPFLPKA